MPPPTASRTPALQYIAPAFAQSHRAGDKLRSNSQATAGSASALTKESALRPVSEWLLWYAALHPGMHPELSTSSNYNSARTMPAAAAMAVLLQRLTKYTCVSPLTDARRHHARACTFIILIRLPVFPSTADFELLLSIQAQCAPHT